MPIVGRLRPTPGRPGPAHQARATPSSRHKACSLPVAGVRLAIEQASWKYAHKWAMFADSAATRFWQDVCENAWAEGRVHVQFLAIDGRPAAYNLGYIVGDEYAYLKTTFGDEFRDLGAATFLRARLVEDLIDRGIHLVDFPGEPYDWERQWTAELRRHIMLTAC